ncbi:TetR/AcrR family transcriptional regulator C-terminal ligand-binding domain-containing protein, partial [Micromonospora sp. KC723]|uniref:TetR/AcrR family transcriptional regulator C-terminal ligand-binding domain-containing protein n=1 Tax=Micromonospora sp. KC723 TaxID=2530381 RepID=UPI001FB7D9CC
MVADHGQGRTRRSLADVMTTCRAAVLAEVADVGLGRLAVEGVARRAGIAKTSIYRHWASVDELLLDALSHAHPVEVATPGGGNLRSDLLRSLEQLVGWLGGPTAPAVAAILSERQRRPDLVEALYTRVFDTHGGRFTRTVIEHYAERGEVDARLVTPIVVDIGEALVIKHQIDTGELPDAEVRTAIVDQAILPALGFP